MKRAPDQSSDAIAPAEPRRPSSNSSSTSSGGGFGTARARIPSIAPPLVPSSSQTRDERAHPQSPQARRHHSGEATPDTQPGWQHAWWQESPHDDPDAIERYARETREPREADEAREIAVADDPRESSGDPQESHESADARYARPSIFPTPGAAGARGASNAPATADAPFAPNALQHDALLSEPQTPPRNAAWIVSALQRRALDVLASVLPRHRPVVLLDFPNHANVGDNAIWIGQISLLRRLGVQLSSYSCSAEDLNLEQVRRAVGSGTILLNGGGNFGDLWPSYQQFREKIVSAFPQNRIVQLSQTMYFRSREALDRTRAIFDAHPRLTLLFRDQESLAQAQREFNVRTLLCPDMAFGLGRLARPAPPSTDVVVLSRTDREMPAGGAIASTTDPSSPGVRVELDDWLDEPPMRLPRLVNSLEQMLRRYPRRLAALTHVRGPLYERVGRLRLQIGTRFLSRGRVVVTNRLHGHILCLLMDIPHVFLDNSYHKNRNFYESWTSTCTLSHWCDEPRQAVQVAQNLL